MVSSPVWCCSDTDKNTPRGFPRHIKVFPLFLAMMSCPRELTVLSSLMDKCLCCLMHLLHSHSARSDCDCVPTLWLLPQAQYISQLKKALKGTFSGAVLSNGVVMPLLGWSPRRPTALDSSMTPNAVPLLV